MGMFGPWGECHSSSHSKVSTELYYPVQTSALKTVFDAFIQALPAEKQVIIRRPYYIREILNTDTPLPDSAAYTNTNQARSGYHNDAYLNSADDGGTFAHGWSRSQELTYISQMTKHTFFGGETFGTPNSTYNNYSNALYESELQHMTYLNIDYQTSIYDVWDSSGKDTFTRRLGYRFVLNSIEYSEEVSPGGIFHLIINLKNTGFSSPHLLRPVELILKLGITELKATVSVDPRFWNREEDNIIIDRRFKIPANIQTGNWEVYLNLPDKALSIFSNPAYSIRFANNNVWIPASGYNKIIDSVPIHQDAPGQTTTETSFYEINPNATPVPLILGDVNSDGNVNIIDALLVAMYYIGLNPPDLVDLTAADTNCDSNINIIDALLIAQFYVSLIISFTNCTP